MPSFPIEVSPHRIPADPTRAWELAYRPDIAADDPWQILHPLHCDPPFCDVLGPAYLRVYYQVGDELWRHFIWLPYPGAWRIRPVDHVLEPLPDPPNPPGGFFDCWTFTKGPFDPMNEPTTPNPLPGTVLVSLAANGTGDFWKKTELSMTLGATEDEIKAALDQADTMHTQLAARMYGPASTDPPPAAPPPGDGTETITATTPQTHANLSQAGADGTTTRTTARATDKQVKAIYAIARHERNWNDDQVETECARQYADRHPNDLSKEEASRFIDFLKNAKAPGQRAA